MNPSANESSNTNLISREEWADLLIRVISPELGSNVRRQTRRYSVAGEVRAVYSDSGRTVRRSFDVLAVSAQGLTVRSHCEVAADVIVDLEINLDGNPVAARGRVIHCTGTLGGYKIGIKLMFD